MGKWSMSNIVQQRRCAHRGAIFRSDRVSLAQPIKNPCNEMQRTKAMCKPRVFWSLISIEAESQLFDSAQSLKFWRVNQAHHQSILGAVIAQRNDVVNGIAINSLGHIRLAPSACNRPLRRSRQALSTSQLQRSHNS